METILAVTAHPDDESFLFGGALAMHARRGGRAGLLCLTDGQAGRTGDLVDRAGLGAFRRAELVRAARILGIPHLFTPGLQDGALDDLGDDAGSRLVAEFAERFGADVLLTFGPEGASGHKDHRACWRWTVAAAGRLRVFAATYPEEHREIARGGPPLPVTAVIDVSPLGNAKRRAFLEHRTQVDHLELFDRVLALFAGREFYHRVRPPWAGGPHASSFD